MFQHSKLHYIPSWCWQKEKKIPNLTNAVEPSDLEDYQCFWRIINVSGRRERAKIPWNQQQKLSHRAGNTPTRVIHLCWPSWCSECQLTLSPVNPAALEQQGMCISMYKHTASKTSQLIWAINKMARSLGGDSPTRCEMAHQIAASNTLFSCSIITIQKIFHYLVRKKSQSQDCRLFSRVLKSIVLCFFNT